MLAKLTQSETALSQAHFKSLTHLLVVLPKPRNEADSFSRAFPGEATLRNTFKRRNKKFTDLIDEPIAAQTPEGKLAAWVMLDPAKSRFEQLTAMRKAVKLLLDESPPALYVSLHGEDGERQERGADRFGEKGAAGRHGVGRGRAGREKRRVREVLAIDHRRGFAPGGAAHEPAGRLERLERPGEDDVEKGRGRERSRDLGQ